jgi:hypothetical protein
MVVIQLLVQSVPITTKVLSQWENKKMFFAIWLKLKGHVSYCHHLASLFINLSSDVNAVQWLCVCKRILTLDQKEEFCEV